MGVISERIKTKYLVAILTICILLIFGGLSYGVWDFPVQSRTDIYVFRSIIIDRYEITAEIV